MRILHILEATQGGTRRHVLDLLPALRARGITCDLIYSPARYPAFEHDAAWLRECGIGALAMPMTRGWGGTADVAVLRAMGAHLRKQPYDVIHCHSTKAGFLGRLLQPFGRARPPVVYTPHCLAFDTTLPPPQRRAARIVEKLLAPRTAHFIAVSRHEYRVMRRAGLCRAGRASIIYNGIALLAFDRLLQSPPHDPPTSRPGFTIGCFGRLTRQKNQEVLLRALPLVRQQVPHAGLLLVGDGEDAAMLRTLARHLKVEQSVVWAGDVEEARPYYALCDLVAQPSRWEGCPYSVLEAMAARRAVVATRVGGVPELIRDRDPMHHSTGVMCKPARPACLAESIVSLATRHEVREQLGEAARRRVAAEFNLAQMVAKTVAVYETVGAGGQKSHAAAIRCEPKL